MSAHQDHVLVPELLRQRLAEVSGADEHVGVAAGFADLEDRHAAAEESAHVRHRTQPRALGGAERDERPRVAMHDRGHFRAQLVDFAVDEALRILRPVRMGERVALEVEGDDVLRRDHARRQVPRHEIEVRVGRMAHAQMSEGIDDVIVKQNFVAQDEVIEQILRQLGQFGRTRRARRCLGLLHQAILPSGLPLSSKARW